MLTPEKDKLSAMSLEEAAAYYGKSTRTIRRWLKKAGIYQPQEKYQPGKIDKQKALQIRRLEKEGLTQTEIAEKFNISQPMVGKIINNYAHKLNFSLGGSAGCHFNPNKP